MKAVGGVKNIVITGSSRGIGFALAQRFLEMGYRVTLSGVNSDNLHRAAASLATQGYQVQCVLCDVTDRKEVETLWRRAQSHWGTVDIWINNAGIVHTETSIWEVTADEVQRLVDTNLVGVVYGSQVAAAGMIEQGYGTIYNMEGFGSNNEMRRGLSLYGSTKRGLTYFTKALAKELRGSGVKACLLSPGMVVTDLVKHPAGFGSSVAPRPEVVRVFNILGDKPETVTQFLAQRIDRSPRTGTRISWLTPRRIVWRFLMSLFVKRDLFS